MDTEEIFILQCSLVPFVLHITNEFQNTRLAGLNRRLDAVKRHITAYQSLFNIISINHFINHFKGELHMNLNKKISLRMTEKLYDKILLTAIKMDSKFTDFIREAISVSLDAINGTDKKLK
jgi:hypothetical protein